MKPRSQPRRPAPAAPEPPPPPLAVIDIGSNSGRVTVMRIHRNSHLDVLEDSRAPLRLALEVGDAGWLGSDAIDRTIDALRDFRAVALGAGATSILAVATSAVREAANAKELIQRAHRELGIRLVVIDGEREAAFAFLGAVHGLPAENGLLFDLGGGSLEISQFKRRKLCATWTLPLGALRVSDRFFKSEPPTAREGRRLREHVVKSMRKARIPQLAPDETLIGTGGTIRNLAKMAARLRRDPLPHIHGSVLHVDAVRALARRTASLSRAGRAAIPGLNRDRADSIVGGFMTTLVAMEFVGARSLQVSGQGLREGIALATLGQNPPPASHVRKASIEALARRFSTCEADAARSRWQCAEKLLRRLEPAAEPELRETLMHACWIVDAGRAVDYFDRYRNAAMIIAAADLQGFTPRATALLFATLLHADNESSHLTSLRPALRDKDDAMIGRAAILLRIADEVERRNLPAHPAPVRIRLTSDALALTGESLTGWRPRSVADRFRRAFHRELRIGSHHAE